MTLFKQEIIAEYSDKEPNPDDHMLVMVECTAWRSKIQYIAASDHQ